jgi:hypothetical protein
MSADKMSADKMSADEMSADEMPVDEMSVYEMSADKMSVDEMLVDKMSLDKMPVDKMAFHHFLSFWVCGLFPPYLFSSFRFISSMQKTGDTKRYKFRDHASNEYCSTKHIIEDRLFPIVYP